MRDFFTVTELVNHFGVNRTKDPGEMPLEKSFSKTTIWAYNVAGR